MKKLKKGKKRDTGKLTREEQYAIWSFTRLWESVREVQTGVDRLHEVVNHCSAQVATLTLNGTAFVRAMREATEKVGRLTSERDALLAELGKARGAAVSEAPR